MSHKQLQDRAQPLPHPDLQRRLEGRHVLALFVAFFAVIFAVNGFMLFVALKTHSGVVSIEPYRKGLAYNGRIADGERQIASGWSDTAHVEPSGQIAVLMRDREGGPLSGLHLTAVLGRPATAQGDRPATFTEVAPGDYRAMVGPIAPGTWMITLEAFREPDRETPYRAKRRLWLKS